MILSLILVSGWSMSGWRIGWAIASEAITSAIKKIHQKLTDSAPAPFQEAAVAALGCSPDYYVTLRKASSFDSVISINDMFIFLFLVVLSSTDLSE